MFYGDDYDCNVRVCRHEFVYWRDGDKTLGKCRLCGKRIDATKGIEASHD